MYKNEGEVRASEKRLRFSSQAFPADTPLTSDQVVEALLAGGANPFIGEPNAWVAAKMFGQKEWEERFSKFEPPANSA